MEKRLLVCPARRSILPISRSQRTAGIIDDDRDARGWLTAKTPIDCEKEAYEYAFAREKEPRTTARDDRESAIAIREKEVESFPQRNEDSVKAAVNDATRHLTRNFESQKELMQARFDGEKNALLVKIEALEKKVCCKPLIRIDHLLLLLFLIDLFSVYGHIHTSPASGLNRFKRLMTPCTRTGIP
jgi:Arc/MetJ family transcription regulator